MIKQDSKQEYIRMNNYIKWKWSVNSSDTAASVSNNDQIAIKYGNAAGNSKN